VPDSAGALSLVRFESETCGIALQVVGNYYPYVVLKVRTPNIIEAAQVVNGEPSLPCGTFRWSAKAGCFVERGVKGTHYKFLRIGGKVHRTYTGVR